MDLLQTKTVKKLSKEELIQDYVFDETKIIYKNELFKLGWIGL